MTSPWDDRPPSPAPAAPRPTPWPRTTGEPWSVPGGPGPRPPHHAPRGWAPTAAPGAAAPTGPPTGPPSASSSSEAPDGPSEGGRPGSSRGLRALVAVLAATSLVGAGWIARDVVVDDDAAGVGARQISVATGRSEGSAGTTPAPVDGDEPVAAVARALGPAVVQIGMGDGLGSGIVFDASGLVLTNAHVVAGARTVEVTFSDGATVDGEVLGTDELTDVAVVSIEPPEDLVVAALAGTSPTVGDLAVAMGSPFGLEQSVTSGVVSAVGRVVSNPQGATVEMLQTDAPINPGNSGGALANREGEVIGMNTLIYSQSGENNGIGFAIPIQTALEVAERIVNGESLDRGYLGVQSQQSPDGEAGALVAAVPAGGPASEAGLEVGDLIVGVDGEPVAGSPELAAMIQSHRPGDRLVIEVVRDGETLEIEVTLGSLADQ